jgi:thioredoxin-dependent peroxiredoxin
MPLLIGDPAPEFAATASNGQSVSLAALRGKSVVIFFYPRDNTSVCTREVCRFRDDYSEFEKAGASVIGVSSSSDASHESFSSRHQLPYLLVSDANGRLRRTFCVRKPLGFLPGRVTYVIDGEGIIRHVFDSLLAGEQHVDEALAAVRQIAAGASS